MDRVLLSLLLAASALLLGACPSDDGGGLDVAMTDARTFEPEELTVSIGDTVTWNSESDEAHTVTLFDDSLPEGAKYFSSGGAGSESEARDEIGDALIKPDGSFEWTFEEPGEYRYFCIPHESSGMRGTIVVEGG